MTTYKLEGHRPDDCDCEHCKKGLLWWNIYRPEGQIRDGTYEDANNGKWSWCGLSMIPYLTEAEARHRFADTIAFDDDDVWEDSSKCKE